MSEFEHHLEVGEPTFSSQIFAEFAKQKPPPKIRGSQFVKREEKIKPKQIIRKPFVPTPVRPK
jgi:hypothetical protein